MSHWHTRRVSRHRMWVVVAACVCATTGMRADEGHRVTAELIDEAALNFPDGPFGTCIKAVDRPF
ncbi:MAG: hypothetical protein KJ000_27090 [Pirellulaceae bacterium]|nr:hypothetical protein [Pirellulaceae bacterium]